MTDYETAEKNKNITVGVFVVLGLCAFGWLIFKFGDLPTAISKFNSFNIYVQFASAPGVQVDTPVKFCGYQIGRVIEIFSPEVRSDPITKQDYHQIVVVLGIDNKYINIPSNVQVKLMTRGLGSSYIELSVDPSLPLTPLDPNVPETVFLVDGLLLQGSTGMTSEFFPEESQKKLDELAISLNVLIKNANHIIGDPNNRRNLSAALKNLADTTEQANKTLEHLQSFFVAGTATAEELNKAAAKLRIILDKINTGQGSAAKFVNDAQFYESLLENSQQLKLFLEELKTFINKLNEKGVKIKL